MYSFQLQGCSLYSYGFPQFPIARQEFLWLRVGTFYGQEHWRRPPSQTQFLKQQTLNEHETYTLFFVAAQNSEGLQTFVVVIL